MKKTILFLAAILMCITSFGQGQTYVHGYYRSNGTYVEGYHRTLPNNTTSDNWSTKGNVNPYTGKEGTHYPKSEYNPSTSVDYNKTSGHNTTPTYTPPTTYYSASCNCYLTK